MIKSVILLTALTLLRIQQDVRVITYSSGKPESPAYESLSFWIKSGQRAYIRYAHGGNAEDIELRFIGHDTLGGKKIFRARFPGRDTTVFTFVPDGYALQVLARHGKYRRRYTWENEAADSASTCDLCAHSEREAMQWLTQYFLK